MSQKPKTTRTLIADLPESTRELSAAELEHVMGGLAIAGGGLNNGPVVHAPTAAVACSSTFCNDVDCDHAV
jgi:hypothetical protein